MTKGDCYQAAFNAMLDLERQDVLDAHLCHGAVVGTSGEVEGVRFGHAWVELGGAVALDVANGKNVALPRETYYAIGQIEDVHRYTSEEIRQWALRTGHYGPWELDPALP